MVFFIWEDAPENLPTNIKIIKYSSRIESLLSEYDLDISGKDLVEYKNHIYRVLTFVGKFSGASSQIKNTNVLLRIVNDIRKKINNFLSI